MEQYKKLIKELNKYELKELKEALYTGELNWCIERQLDELSVGTYKLPYTVGTCLKVKDMYDEVFFLRIRDIDDDHLRVDRLHNHKELERLVYSENLYLEKFVFTEIGDVNHYKYIQVEEISQYVWDGLYDIYTQCGEDVLKAKHNSYLKAKSYINNEEHN